MVKYTSSNGRVKFHHCTVASSNFRAVVILDDDAWIKSNDIENVYLL